jgi:predicted RNase H-like HicB family nuclease
MLKNNVETIEYNFSFKTYKGDKGYWAECVELPGCFTQGETKKELRANMYEAINCHLSSLE